MRCIAGVREGLLLAYRLFLRCENFRAAHAREPQQSQQRFLIISRAFRGRLNFGDIAVAGQHEIGVGVGRAVLVIIEIENRRALIDAAADCGNLWNAPGLA